MAIPIVLAVIVSVMYRVRPSQLTDTLPSNLGDPALNTWILAWQSHAIANDPGQWFNGNIFVTHGLALGYSETMLPLLPFFAVVYWATGNAVLAHNLLILALLYFSMATTYLLGRYVRLKPIPALVAATGFTFTGFTYSHVAHTQLLTIGCFSLALHLLLRMLERRRTADGVWFGLASAGLIMACLYYAVVWVVMVAAVLVASLLMHRGRPERSWWQVTAVGAATTALVSAPVLGLYAWFQSRIHFERTLGPGTAWSLTDLAAPPVGSSWYGTAAREASYRFLGPEHVFFPGLLVPALASIALVTWCARAWNRRGAPARPGGATVGSDWVLLAVAGAAALLVASGPGLPGVGDAAASLYEALPGFRSIRLPARLAVPALLVLALAAGRGLQIATSGWRWQHAWSVGALVVLLADLSAGVARVGTEPSAADATIYAALDELPGGRVVEIPAASDLDGAPGVYTEAPRMLYSIGDWRGRFNGTSGGNPPGFGEQAALINTFPAADALAFLADHDLRYVVLRTTTRPGEIGVTPEALDEARARFADRIVVDVGVAVLFDLTQPDGEDG